MAPDPMIKSAIFDSSILENKTPSDSGKLFTRYLRPSNTLNCDSITKIAVADENALITGMDINSNMKPVREIVVLHN